MQDFLAPFNARELAVASWVLALSLTFGISSQDFRQSLPRVLKALLQPVLALPILFLAVWAALPVYLLAQVGQWAPALFKDAIFWYVGAIALLFKSVQDGDKPGFFRKVVLELLALSALAKFTLNAYVFSQWTEFLIVPVILLLGMMLGLVQAKREHRRLSKLVGTLLALFAFTMLGHSMLEVVRDPAHFFTAMNARSFILGPILTLWTLPIVFSIVLYAKYEALFRGVTFALEGKSVSARTAKWTIFKRSGLSMENVRKLTGALIGELYTVESVADVAWATDKYLDPDSSPNADPKTVEVVGVRLAPWINPRGVSLTKVFVDWRNVGVEPVEMVYAHITPIDTEGNEIDRTEEGCIFAASDSPVPPGGTYSEPDEDGYLLFVLDGPPASARVEISEVKRPRPCLSDRAEVF